VVKIVETPRDGFQGLSYLIDTNKKIEYINLLLGCGFHTVEIGSFVSPKVIPQMADTARVIEGLNLEGGNSKIAVLVANAGGGKKAMAFEQIDQLIYPFSVSPTFLKKNINQTIEESESVIDQLQNICVKAGKELIVYFSMGFDSAYNDEWSIDLVHYWIRRMMDKGLGIFPFSDILGETSAMKISTVFKSIVSEFTEAEFGLHLHSADNQRIEKVDAAYQAGIRRFDTVVNGLGGCPQTGKELVGNLPLQELLKYLNMKGIPDNLNKSMLYNAINFEF
jgi:hydroxymethylglutaryl-CoA lyase